MDTEQQVEEIRHDLEALERTAERAAERVAPRVALFVLATAVLATLAWFAGRRARNRTDRGH